MKNNTSNKNRVYTKFTIMLAASFLAMYITMYLNTYEWNHIFFSLTRFYMTCLGIATMAFIMWFVMRGMYRNKKKNIAIIAASILLFVSALLLVRDQKTVNDVNYMRAMIPHHSIAILTSERAAIEDPEVRALADRIIETQKKEIAEMKAYIKRLENTTNNK